jgi:protein-tyrosine phosphatase
MGNICRSPAAEGVMRRVLAERGLDGAVEVDSAGTTAYHVGEPPDPRMRQAAAERGYPLAGAARRAVAGDFADFDLVVAMDTSNRDDLERLAPPGARAELRLLSDFLPPGAPRDVPDPYYGGEKGFDTVLDLIEAACPAIADHLLGGETPSAAAGVSRQRRRPSDDESR